MAKFKVASYLFPIKNSLSNIKISNDVLGLMNINYHGTYNNEYYLFTLKSDGYPNNKNFEYGLFYHARHSISPGLNDSTRRMIQYYDTWCYRDFLEYNSPIIVFCSNLHRADDSYIFDNIVRHDNTVYIKYDFISKRAFEYDIDGNKLTEYTIFVGNKVNISGGWVNTGKNLWDLFYIDRIVMYEKFNPQKEVPFYHISFLSIGSVVSNNRSQNSFISIGPFEMKFNEPRILIQKPDDNTIYRIEDDGTFTDVTGSVNLVDYSSFANNARNWKNYYKVSNDDWNSMLGSNDYLIIIHDCRPFIWITRIGTFNIEHNQYLFIRDKQWKTIIIKDNI